MIYEEIMYGIKCDRCHEIYTDADDCTVSSDKYRMEEYASDSEWHVTKEGKHYCPGCYTVSEDDNVVIKPSIHHSFFKFKMVLQAMTGLHYSFHENDTHYLLKYSYRYERTKENVISVLKDMIPDFTVEYEKPSNLIGNRQYEVEIIKIPKDFKPVKA